MNLSIQNTDLINIIYQNTGIKIYEGIIEEFIGQYDKIPRQSKQVS